MSASDDPRGTSRQRRRGALGGRVLRIGRVAGIEVGIDASWILLFGLVTAGLAQVLAQADPRWSGLFVALAGAVGSVAFFLSIFLHELGHSLVAKSLGLRVHSITLYLFGGVAQLGGQPARPRDTFLIAVAGPMVSLCLFFVLFVAHLALGGGGPISEVARVLCGTLATLNLMLVLFNSVPGLPLDGGHVLGALVWALTGSEERGTRVAGASGVAFALLFIGLGAAVSFKGHFLAGMWMVLIGWFMLRSARSVSVQLYLRRQLGRILLRDAVAERSTASRWNTVEDIQDLIGRVRRPVFIVDGEDLLGWVTPEQVQGVAPKKRAFTPVSAILVPVAKLIGLDSKRTLLDALSVMNDRGLQEVAVLEDERPVGAMTRDDLLRVLREGVRPEGGGASAS